MKQFIITTAAGKRLIGKALAVHPVLRNALVSATVVIIAGTTNGYVAEEVFADIGSGESFSRHRFFRGITLPPSRPTTKTGRLPDEKQFPGDVVFIKGIYQKGKTIFDVADDLKEGDIILKGANAVDPVRKRAAILIGDPKGGTILRALQAVVGHRVRLILPAGLEKRVFEDLDTIAALMNAPGSFGPRLLPVPGEIFTEIEAVRLLSGATATLVAGGGVGGAEGSIWLAISGTPKQMDSAEKILKSVASEPAFTL